MAPDAVSRRHSKSNSIFFMSHGGIIKSAQLLVVAKMKPIPKFAEFVLAEQSLERPSFVFTWSDNKQCGWKPFRQFNQTIHSASNSSRMLNFKRINRIHTLVVFS